MARRQEGKRVKSDAYHHTFILPNLSFGKIKTMKNRLAPPLRYGMGISLMPPSLLFLPPCPFALYGDNMEKKNVGGQAVIEGVMMRTPKSLVIAVRKPNDEIVVRREQMHPLGDRYPIFKRPILRGIVVLLESLVWGYKALTFSANEAMDEIESEEESSDAVESPKDKQNELGGFTLALTLIISIVLGMGLFVVLPALVAGWITEKEQKLLFNITDGLIRLGLFLGYVLVISRIKQIARVFQYHGAEHQSTSENAGKYNPIHPRCGTTFLFTVIIVSIVVFSLLGKPEILVRIGSRIILLPVIAGISYEITKLAGRWPNSLLIRILLAPGLLLQRLTTKKPSQEQLQVAITALKEVLAMEEK